MNYDDMTSLACERLEHLADQAAYHQNHGSEVDKLLCVAEMRDLSKSLDSEDEELFFMMYHRYLSDSFGVDFEIDHGDEELMFGGV